MYAENESVVETVVYLTDENRCAMSMVFLGVARVSGPPPPTPTPTILALAATKAWSHESQSPKYV